MRIVTYPHTSRSGIGTYILEITQYLKKSNMVFAIGDTDATDFELSRNTGVWMITPPKALINRFKPLDMFPPLVYLDYYLRSKGISKIINTIQPDFFVYSTLTPFLKTDVKKIEIAWDYPKSVIDCFKLAKKYSPWFLLPYFFLREIEFSIMNYFSLRGADKIFTVSSKVENELKQRGYNAKYISPGINILPTQQKYDKLTLCFAGRNHIFTKRKGLKHLLGALLLLEPKLKSVDYQLMVVGRIPKYANKILSTKYKGIQHRITLTGEVNREKWMEIISKCHLLIAPSYHDEFGFVVLESMMFGTPVIASNNPSFMDLIDSRSGICMDPKRTDVFAKELEFMMDINRLKEMGDWARRRVIENFSWDVIMNKIKEELKTNELR